MLMSVDEQKKRKLTQNSSLSFHQTVMNLFASFQILSISLGEMVSKYEMGI